MTTDQLKEVLGNYKWTLLVALIMFAMVGFGYKLARIIDEGDSKKVQAQQETIAILSEENHALTTKVNQLEVAMELATLETESITNTLGEQKKELEAQQELLSFYERVVAPEKTDEGFAIEGVEVFKLSDNTYQLRLVLLQSKQQKAVINGSLDIAVVGQRNGEVITLKSGESSLLAEDIKYRFRFFQAVNVTLTIEEDINPETISFSTTVYQYKTRKGSYEISVPWNEALSVEIE
ncbi:DUF6776 family protein [Alteromonas macleodii]|uniref:Uncharacterized protein n=1 Tax=Alteromonas macleodii (strain English Channel 673) TaxID=1004788 RepID=A0AB33A1Z0_ALTME|nr:DUF6776 family protein [Alteromonas macleodii]MAL72786.1 hypothetical protein [Alteromonas sp.]MEC8903364.1 DUF6776 family protein [Pseudomonadota bacterium]AFT75737.1 hypothetical protein AMEC673_15275 [Alteromonas macleodii str. 'English Channel 673']MAN43847.1 hypothetical protein [Alteromonas sp.]MBL3811581.1 hypothetical protein [Alteromonas macleodii]